MVWDNLLSYPSLPECKLWRLKEDLWGHLFFTPEVWRQLSPVEVRDFSKEKLEWIPPTTLPPTGAKNVPSCTSSREIQDLQG